MAEKEGSSHEAESTCFRDRPSEQRIEDQWRNFCRLTAWIIVNTSMTWDEVLELSPERLKFVAKAIEKRRTRDKLAIFDAQAALIDENSLSRLNSELRESEKG